MSEPTPAPPSGATEATLPIAMPASDSTHRWFSSNGCVEWGQDGVRSVYVGGSLISFFTEREGGRRNLIAAMLAEDPDVHLGRLAWAFGISAETLRLIRRRYESGGIKAIVHRRKGGRPTVESPALVRRIESLFEQGLSVTQVHARAAKGQTISRAKVGLLRREWAKRKAATAMPELPAQLPLAVEARAEVLPEATNAGSADEAAVSAEVPPIRIAKPSNESERDVRAAPEFGSPEEGGAIELVEEAAPRSRRFVQYAGSWLLVALIARLGLYDRAKAVAASKVHVGRLRVALDAVAIALAIGEKCVEGVRRLATKSATALLLAASAPSASWVRRTLGRFAANDVGEQLHWAVGGDMVRRAGGRARRRPAVFYVDNHLRKYTGKRRVRWGWRMQDKRARPGVTDYWVSDVDGRPLWRVAVPTHDSLASFLVPIAMLLRATLGDELRILIAFDRGGSFPEPLGELRVSNVEFVTYERRPYRRFARHLFDRELDLDGVKVGLHESRANLGGGRGRVRRVSLRMPDKKQVNLLAVSDEDAAWLVEVMSGRWCQENGFKHGVERWGMNQLDGRKFAAYAPDEVIPNPGRRRLEQALKLSRAHEGDLRNRLARLAADAPERQNLEQDLAMALRTQQDLEALRPSNPEHVTVAEARLVGELVKHVGEYKAVIDSIRVAAANTETDLAAEIAPHLGRPREAKRVLRNLFHAPGSVSVAEDTITVRLDVAGTRNELDAIQALFRIVNRWKLRLPGDPKGRRLCFRSQIA